MKGGQSLELSIPFRLQNEEYDEIAAEFNILFRENRNSLEKLLEFLEKYPDKRINIEMDKIDVSLLKLANRAHDNIAVRMTDMAHYQSIDELREAGIQFFFDFKLNPCRGMCDLDSFASLGVSDVYFADDLMYNLREAKKAADSHGIKTRIVMNHVPYTLPDRNPKVPWFSPDCVDLISPYFDIVEFDFKNSPNGWHNFGVYYRAWITKKRWHGDLSELYKDLNVFIPNDSLFSEELIRYKIHCGRHCANKDTVCRRCEQYVELALELDEKSIGLNKE